MDKDLERMPGESEEQYFLRICKMKSSLGFTWSQMSDLFNKEFDCYKGEDAYRKRWTAYNGGPKVKVQTPVSGDTAYLDEMKEATNELYKAKRQLSDQRREYNKLLTRAARADNLAEKLIEAASIVPLNDYSNVFMMDNTVSEKEALLCLSDWHYGAVSNNIWNTYNTDICKQRVMTLFRKVVSALCEHRVCTLNIALLGDFVSGAIHTGVRVASEENICEQLMHVSEMLANLINELSMYVETINVYSTYGNHARTVQDKKDSIHADNMERIIPWWIKQRLMDNRKVNVIDSEYHEFIYFDICGHSCVCTHGDLDKFKNIGVTINSLFTKKFGKTIEYTFSGDKHHLEAFEQFGVESALVGSLCGTDEYANNRRLYSNAMQTLCIFTPEDGKMCSYNMIL